ncbi:L,D-transpeptidase family protein [Salinisphaera sp. SPP-AMP-43]|uniref:L,D-transpeptidase family protein n=1 Tax=Salinisphaera sp. SPP-AMP-43 TaxID=3121288 RepID=UPI003C6DE27F
MLRGQYLATIGIAGLLWGSAAEAWAQAADEPVPMVQQLRASVGPMRTAAAFGDATADQARAFYAARGFRPAWNRPETVSAFVAALYTLGDDGLAPSAYGADRLEAAYRRAYAVQRDVSARVRFDRVATRVYLSVLGDLNRGKVDPDLLKPAWGLSVERYRPDPDRLSQALDALDFERVFTNARPSYAAYQRLRAGLARYREIQRRGGWPQIPARPAALHPGDRDPAIAGLRQRLAAIGEPVAISDTPDVYDRTLAEAVRRFQRDHYLDTDAVVGARTRAALNVGVGARIDQIRVNLERARLLMHALPQSFVLVDIAGYQLSYYRPNGRIWRTRIVVGKPYRRTPSLRSRITHLNLNPPWTVPYSIVRREMLPRIRRDPSYLARESLHVLTPAGRRLDPKRIDWQHPPSIVLRQEAGPNNALGRVVFRFANPYSVYLHDTPAKTLFNQPRRAFSHGCIRVQNALEFARLLLDDAQQWNAVALQRAVATGQTRRVNLARPVPVIVHYWTVNVAKDGGLAFKPDIYRRDYAMREALDRRLAVLNRLP